VKKIIQFSDGKCNEYEVLKRGEDEEQNNENQKQTQQSSFKKKTGR
jgi:hypothetical protein